MGEAEKMTPEFMTSKSAPSQELLNIHHLLLTGYFSFKRKKPEIADEIITARTAIEKGVEYHKDLSIRQIQNETERVLGGRHYTDATRTVTRATAVKHLHHAQVSKINNFVALTVTSFH